MSDVEKFVLRINENDWTIGDLEDFEQVAGVSFIEALQPKPLRDAEGNRVMDEKGRPQSEVSFNPTVLKALIWITKRREVPGFTVEDARNVKVTGLEVAELGGESDPKETSD
jgi:hypothetical protein